MKKILLFLISCSAMLNMAFASQNCQENPVYCKWLVYYSNQPNDFQPFDPIVFDPDSHPNLAQLHSVKTLLGYLSLGEVSVKRSYYNYALNAGVLIAANPHSPGSWYVDVRKPAWKNLLINTVIPNILNEGFNGLFLDTLDLSVYLEHVNPSAYHGMIAAAIDLVIQIRKYFPQIKLMLSRAYPVLAGVGGVINYALGEGILTRNDPQTGRYYYTTSKEYHSQVTNLQNAQALYPNLTVMSLDFWDPTDFSTIRKIYKTERQNGFRPYVGAARLQQIVPEY